MSTEPTLEVDVTEPDGAGAVTVTITGVPTDVGALFREVAMSTWPGVPDEPPDNLLKPAGLYAALPLAAQVARLTLTAREIGDLPPTVRYLLRSLNRQVAPLSRPCVCGAVEWTWCRTSTGTSTAAHRFRQTSGQPT